MKNTFTVLALFLVSTGSSIAFTPSAQASDKAKPASGAILVPTADLQWRDVPGFSGVQLAAVDGDPTKGPSHLYLKFVAGFAAPLHHHSANHSGTVVSGTLLLTIDGKEQRLPAGSFFKLTDKAKHTTTCAAGAECVLSMDVHGKWDVVPEPDKVAAKK
jgi:quercetin dioxygenase-like cupin family protein